MLNQQSNFDYQSVGKRVVRIEHESIEQLDQYINIDFSRACEMILTCCGKVIIMGIGKSGHIGSKIAATLASTGTPAFFVHPGEACHGDLGMVSTNDIVVAISNSGECNEILMLIPMLKRQNILLICITSRPESSMGQASDIHLCIKVPQEACPLGLSPTSSSAATLVMGDALAVALLEARGFTQQDFALSHPGGALGKKLLLHVSDIMHSGQDIPHVTRDTLLRDALLEITRKKLGLTVIVDHFMKIEGIFTDGDLRRALSLGIDFTLTFIQDVMTHGGIRVPPNMLAIDALNLIQNKNINALLVSDDNDKLLGVIHLHDMLRAAVI
ncbi:arabinose-5-phosphate isomerase KdsD [Pantoea sp. Mhis]|uniref:arabinose-5-phosphate isomerase KdsD n=1 Tax=Pantoea sp. Mhis TaxID=2576759 RepID=UPI00135A6B3C|nr:arabinose-5-phosphate isomerase KdsD [Pantoea sp. Mhis]MXP56429.1 arabinose-5-phosphate isomerase KdsD [Pantoea sp. Mhis]